MPQHPTKDVSLKHNTSANNSLKCLLPRNSSGLAQNKQDSPTKTQTSGYSGFTLGMYVMSEHLYVWLGPVSSGLAKAFDPRLPRPFFRLPSLRKGIPQLDSDPNKHPNRILMGSHQKGSSKYLNTAVALLLPSTTERGSASKKNWGSSHIGITREKGPRKAPDNPRKAPSFKASCGYPGKPPYMSMLPFAAGIRLLWRPKRNAPFLGGTPPKKERERERKIKNEAPLSQGQPDQKPKRRLPTASTQAVLAPTR